MEHFTIRYAAIDDYAEVEKIMMQVHNLHVAWRPDIYRPSDVVLPLAEYEDAVRQQQFIIAEYEDKIVGILFFVIRHVESNTQVSRNTLFIDSLAVDEAYRGKGIGRQLLNLANKIRKAKNLDAVELQVNAKNLDARRMYEAFGFTEKSINMELL